MYEKEVVQQAEKIEKMKAEGKDEYDIKKMVKYLECWLLSRGTRQYNKTFRKIGYLLKTYVYHIYIPKRIDELKICFFAR